MNRCTRLAPRTTPPPDELGPGADAWRSGGRRWSALLLLAVGWFIDAEQFFRSYLVGWLFWVGVALGLARPPDAPPPVARRLGPGHPPRSSRPRRAPCRCSLVLFLPIASACSTSSRGAGPRRSATPSCSTRCCTSTAVLPRPGGPLLRVLVRLRLRPLAPVAAPGRDRRRPGSSAACSRSPGPAFRLFVLLATIAGVDWLMSLDPHWFSTIYGVYFLIAPGARRARLHRPGRGLARRAASRWTRVRPAAALPRLRQAAPRLRHAVGLLLLLAVPDHLVGQPAGGDHLLPEPPRTAAGGR